MELREADTPVSVKIWLSTATPHDADFMASFSSGLAAGAGPPLLLERGLAFHLGIKRHPDDGNRLAVDWAHNYDPRQGNGLNGPSLGTL